MKDNMLNCSQIKYFLEAAYNLDASVHAPVARAQWRNGNFPLLVAQDCYLLTVFLSVASPGLCFLRPDAAGCGGLIFSKSSTDPSDGSGGRALIRDTVAASFSESSINRAYLRIEESDRRSFDSAGAKNPACLTQDDRLVFVRTSRTGLRRPAEEEMDGFGEQDEDYDGDGKEAGAPE
jgi:hypothetical protein